MIRSPGLWAAKGGGRRPPLFIGAYLLAAAALLMFVDGLHAQAVVVYRCEGASVLYTDALTPQQARQRGCTAIDPEPLTVGVGRATTQRETISAASAAKSTTAKPAALPPEALVREQQALRILQAEWTRETQALAALQKQLAAPGAATQADQAKLQQTIARKQSDVQALQREIARRQGALAP